MDIQPVQATLLSFAAQVRDLTLHHFGQLLGHPLKAAEKQALAQLVEAGLLERNKSGPYRLGVEGFWMLLSLHFNQPDLLPGPLTFKVWPWASHANNLMRGKQARWPKSTLDESDRALFCAANATLVFGHLSAEVQNILLSCWHGEQFMSAQPTYPWHELYFEADNPTMAERLAYMQFEQEELLGDRVHPCQLAATELMSLLRQGADNGQPLAEGLQHALSAWRARTAQKGFFPGGLTLIWLGLMAISKGESARCYKEALRWAKKQQPWLLPAVDIMGEAANASPVMISSILKAWRPELEEFAKDEWLPYGQLWVALCVLWQANRDDGISLQMATWQLDAFLAATPRHLLMALCQGLIGLMLDRPTGMALFGGMAKPQLWENWLAALPQPELLKPQQERLVWQLEPGAGEVHCRLQKRSAKGSWSGGRRLNMWDLEPLYPAAATDLDLRIGNMLRNRSYYTMAPDLAALQLLGQHPLLQTGKGEPLSLIFNTPLLSLEQQDGRWQASLHPALIRKPGAASYQVTSLSADLWQIDALPGEVERLLQHLASIPALPEAALPQLAASLNAQPQLDWISSHPALITHTELSPWPGVPSVLADLQQDVLTLTLGSLPEGALGHPLPLGEGSEFIKEWHSPHHFWQRDLAVERALAKGIRKALALTGKGPWTVTGMEMLPLLERFASLDELGVTLRWHNDSQRVHLVDDSALRLQVDQQQEWLAISGGLEVDAGQVLELRLLLRQIRGGRRYIQLEGQQAQLLLSEQLAMRLSTLAALVDEQQQISTRLAYPLMYLLEQTTVAGDAGWNNLTRQWQQVADCPAPLLQPLREYQKTGVQWMANLAQHRFGACLADDMGLGKTIQALTLLRLRQAQGPALVIMPTSLLSNWREEAARFAPELTVVVLNEQQDRAASLDQIGPGTLLLTTYGLLTSHSELAEVSWATIVADEAQQIKNAGTARAKALFKLEGDFRLALSGTPIENHLGELWSLFNFINPGLLGNQTSFKQRFGKASRDPVHLAQLKTVIAPFVLRRLKREVLTELPEKTEIVHHLTLSPAEMALYEASRREAVSQMASAEGHNLMIMLSSLTRLRRICCSPALLLPDWNKEQSKLEAAMELILDAIDNGHRILVFSQFVDLLSLLRQRLAAAFLDYCYLDGSCSASQRQHAIQRFKREPVPLFLISLKAGGTGLNLTEADTVIHLDPWWNPAVEDQASDRAHRIGQTEPVTVYRLVCEQTVEEKIVALHAQKRELAEGVLGEQSEVAQLDAGVIRRLLTAG